MGGGGGGLRDEIIPLIAWLHMGWTWGEHLGVSGETLSEGFHQSWSLTCCLGHLQWCSGSTVLCAH